LVLPEWHRIEDSWRREISRSFAARAAASASAHRPPQFRPITSTESSALPYCRQPQRGAWAAVARD